MTLILVYGHRVAITPLGYVSHIIVAGHVVVILIDSGTIVIAGLNDGDSIVPAAPIRSIALSNRGCVKRSALSNTCIAGILSIYLPNTCNIA